MKETQERFAKDRSNYEQKYNERLNQLQQQENSIKEKEESLNNEKDRFANYQKEQGLDVLTKKLEAVEAENKLLKEKNEKQEKHVIFQADKLKEMEATV
jgi:hypothetical protein